MKKILLWCFLGLMLLGGYCLTIGRGRVVQMAKYQLYKRLFSGPVINVWGNFIFQPAIYTGNYVYAGMDLKLAVFDVSVPKNIHLVQAFRQYGMLRMCLYEQKTLYCACSHMGLSVFDASREGRLKQISHYILPGYSSSMAKRGSILFIAAREPGVHVVSVKRKNSPELLKTLKVGWANFANVYGNYLYATVHKKGVVILDISNPVNPRLIGKLNITYTPKYKPLDPLPHEMALVKGVLYVGNGVRGLAMIDVRNPRKPALKGYFSTGKFISNVVAVGNTLMVGGPPDVKFYLDVSRPFHPVLIKTLPEYPDHPNLGFLNGRAVMGVDRYGFSLLDVRAPGKLKVLGTYRTPPVARRIDLKDNLLVVGACSGGAEIYDVSVPGNPRPLNRVDTPGCVHGVFISEPYMYAADGLFGIYVVDVRKPARPELVTVFHFERHPWSVWVDEGFAYLASGSKGLTVFDVHKPRSPRLVSINERSGDYSMTVFKAGKFVYFSGLFNGFHVFDVSDPKNPVFLPPAGPAGFKEKVLEIFQGRVMDIAVKGDFLFAAKYWRGLEVFDVRNPKKPVRVTRRRTGGYPYGFFLQNNLLYVANYTKGVQVFDVSFPSTPRLLKTYRTPGHSHHLAVRGSFAYVADGEKGLAVINLKDKTVSYPPEPQRVYNASPF